MFDVCLLMSGYAKYWRSGHTSYVGLPRGLYWKAGDVKLSEAVWLEYGFTGLDYM